MHSCHSISCYYCSDNKRKYKFHQINDLFNKPQSDNNNNDNDVAADDYDYGQKNKKRKDSPSLVKFRVVLTNCGVPGGWSRDKTTLDTVADLVKSSSPPVAVESDNKVTFQNNKEKLENFFTNDSTASDVTTNNYVCPSVEKIYDNNNNNKKNDKEEEKKKKKSNKKQKKSHHHQKQQIVSTTNNSSNMSSNEIMNIINSFIVASWCNTKFIITLSIVIVILAMAISVFIGFYLSSLSE